MQQLQFMDPMPPVQYQAIPPPWFIGNGPFSGYANQHGLAAQGPMNQPFVPNVEPQLNLNGPVATPHAGTPQIARVSKNAVAFEIDDRAEDLMTNPEELLKPKALKETWLSTSERQHRIQVESLEQKQKFLEEYVDKMDVAQYSDLDYRRLVRNTISMITGWLRALDNLRSQDENRQEDEEAASQKRLMNKHHSFVVRGIAGQPPFETGIIDRDWRLRDIRRKRFINCGVQCALCSGGEADHPERTHNEMYEIFSYFVGPKLANREKRCRICMKQRFTKKARLHQTHQHDLGMWYDHPDNDVDQLGQYEGWRHDFPGKDLKWKPKPVAQMDTDMRRKQIPATAHE